MSALSPLSRRLLSALALCLCCLAARATPAQEPSVRKAPWTARELELAESLPIQDGGRVKPLSTFAGFTLLRLNGKRSATTAQGEKLSPVEWLLDTLYFPEDASRCEVFLVQNAEVIEALGLKLEGKEKRDRYSLDELRPGLQRLFSLAHDYGALEEKDRSSVQQQLVNLAENVLSFVQLNRHESLALIPPVASVAAQPDWTTPAEVAEHREHSDAVPPEHAEILQRFEALAASRLDPAAFERELGALHERIVGLARARGEYDGIGLEIAYYKADLLTWSLTAFVLSFLSIAVLWLRPRSTALYRIAWSTVLGGALVLVAAIVVRCMIRGRPPVSTLYETVLFVTAVGTLVALFLEAVDRRRIAISAAAFLGMVGLFIANGYETLDKKDTMPSLVAVLDTNFWLATHVTAITVGYSAGMLAALLASLYLVTKALRLKRGDPSFHRTLSRMVYGVLCFGMIFATVGTILGGIWANESWGRFWGWDPKENGALLIVITQIVILHARLGGYLREHGICMAAAFGGTVVAFSWWGVNLLGVGLHSYGFTSGIHTALWSYYALQWGIVALGGLAWLRERAAARAGASTSFAPATSGSIRAGVAATADAVCVAAPPLLPSGRTQRGERDAEPRGR